MHNSSFTWKVFPVNINYAMIVFLMQFTVSPVSYQLVILELLGSKMQSDFGANLVSLSLGQKHTCVSV